MRRSLVVGALFALVVAVFAYGQERPNAPQDKPAAQDRPDFSGTWEPSGGGGTGTLIVTQTRDQMTIEREGQSASRIAYVLDEGAGADPTAAGDDPAGRGGRGGNAGRGRVGGGGTGYGAAPPPPPSGYSYAPRGRGAEAAAMEPSTFRWSREGLVVTTNTSAPGGPVHIVQIWTMNADGTLQIQQVGGGTKTYTKRQ